MGKTISIAEESAKLEAARSKHKQQRQRQSLSTSACSINTSTASPYTRYPSSNAISRSSSNASISQLTTSSLSSQQSTTSISHRFVSYDNDDTLIRIARNNNNQQSQCWRFKLVRKDEPNDHDNDTMASPLSSPSCSNANMNVNCDDYIVFGLCDASLLEQGYKHKYYGYGYSVTYCHGFKFESYSDAFPLQTEIVAKYDAQKRQLSFWCNGQRKARVFCIPSHPTHDYLVTIKAYREQCAIQML